MLRPRLSTRSIRRRVAPSLTALVFVAVICAPAFAADPPVAPAPDAPAAVTPEPVETGLCSVSATGPLATGVRSLDRPVPFPEYCDDCRPCSVQGHCGVQGGSYLGVCSPNPSYCGYPGYAACVCY